MRKEKVVSEPFRDPGETVEPYTPEQLVAWCRQVIARTATSLYRTQRRWDRDILGETLLPPISLCR